MWDILYFEDNQSAIEIVIHRNNPSGLLLAH